MWVIEVREANCAIHSYGLLHARLVKANEEAKTSADVTNVSNGLPDVNHSVYIYIYSLLIMLACSQSYQETLNSVCEYYVII